MSFDEVTKRVTPDNREGRLQIFKEGPAKVFFWSDAKSGERDEPIYTLPQLAVFEKVKQVSSRIYLLRYSGSNRRSFFWIQEDPSKDESICKRVNELINEELFAETPDPSEPMEGVESVGEGSVGQESQSEAAKDAQELSRFVAMLSGITQPTEKSKSYIYH